MTETAAMTAPRRPLASRRHQARRLALQAIYGHLLAGAPTVELLDYCRQAESHARCDQDYFERLLRGVLDDVTGLEGQFAPYLDRPMAQLDPVEHAVLLLAAYELAHCPELPYRIVINEAVELSKLFGATDGHRYINGVVDRMAHKLRSTEIAAGS